MDIYSGQVELYPKDTTTTSAPDSTVEQTNISAEKEPESSSGKQDSSTQEQSALHDAPRQAALALLSLLLTTPPYLPASVKSKDVKRRHNVLNLAPENADEYLVTSYANLEEGTSARVVELLNDLRGQVEQMKEDGPSTVVGAPRFKDIGFGELVAAIDLGDVTQTSSAPLLTLLLKREGPSDENTSFKYDNLLPYGAAAGPWMDQIAEGADPVPPPIDPSQAAASVLPTPQGESNEKPSAPTRPGPVSRHNSLSSSASRSFWTASEIESSPGTRSSRASQSLEPSRSPSRQGPSSLASNGQHQLSSESNDGQQIDAEYITDPNEFWGGFSDNEDNKEDDDEKDDKGTSKDNQQEEDAITKEAAEKAKEDAYWAMYDQEQAEDEDEGSTYQLLGSSRHADGGSGPGFEGISHRNAVDRFRDMQLDGHDNASSDAEASTIRSHIRPAPLTSTEDNETSFGDDERTEEGTVHSSQRAPSLRSDQTDFGTDDGTEGGGATANGPRKKKSLVNVGDLAAYAKTQRNAFAGGHDDDEIDTSFNEQDDDEVEQDFSIRDNADSTQDARERQGAKTHTADHQQQQAAPVAREHDGRRGSVSMYSTSGQSYFETPADMNLKDLEDFYRNRDLQHSLEQRERIQRASHPELFEDFRERQQPPAGSLPGLDGRIMSSRSSASVGHEDPITALAFAEPDLAVADSHVRSPSRRPAVPRSASMGTLRKLLEQSGIEDVDAASALQGARDSLRLMPSDSGNGSANPSKAGGFQNFLNLAPSVNSDWSANDELETRSMSLNVPPSVAEDFEGEEEGDEYEGDPEEQGQKHDEPDDDDQQDGRYHGGDHGGDGDGDYDFDDGKSAIREDFDAHPQPPPPPQRERKAQTLLQRRGFGPDTSSSRGYDSDNADGLLMRGQHDLDDFMFPGLIKPPKTPALDSPHASESDPLVKQVAESIRSSRQQQQQQQRGRSAYDEDATGGRRNAGQDRQSVTFSDTFLPSASSEASMMPLMGSIAGYSGGHRPRRGSDGGSSVVQLRDGESMTGGDRASEVRSTDTDLGRGAGDLEDRRWSSSVRAPRQQRAGLQDARWPRGAGPRQAMTPSPSMEHPQQQQQGRQRRQEQQQQSQQHQHQQQQQQQQPLPRHLRGIAAKSGGKTAQLMQEHLKQQRQQALQIQRDRVQAREEGNSPKEQRREIVEQDTRRDHADHLQEQDQDPNGISQWIYPAAGHGEGHVAPATRGGNAEGVLVSDHPPVEENATFAEDSTGEDGRGDAKRKRPRSRKRQQTRSVDLTNRRETLSPRMQVPMLPEDLDSNEGDEGDDRPDLAAEEDAGKYHQQQQEEEEEEEEEEEVSASMSNKSDPGDEEPMQSGATDEAIADGEDGEVMLRSTQDTMLARRPSSQRTRPSAESLRRVVERPGEEGVDSNYMRREAGENAKRSPIIVGGTVQEEEEEEEGEGTRETEEEEEADEGQLRNSQELPASSHGNAEVARRRRETVRMIHSRNEATKSIMKGALKLMEEINAAMKHDHGANSSPPDAGVAHERVSEADFLRLAREAYRESHESHGK